MLTHLTTVALELVLRPLPLLLRPPQLLSLLLQRFDCLPQRVEQPLLGGRFFLRLGQLGLHLL